METTVATHPTREAWLMALVEKMRPVFDGIGHPLPAKVRASAGWPTRGALAKAGKKSRTIGQCFARACSKDETSEVFVSPVLADALTVAATLAHELAHAADDCKHGHGPVFSRMVRAIGLEGPATATVPGDDFKTWVSPMLAGLGAYPHASLDLLAMPVKKQTTRMVKVTCSACGYTARTTRKWLTTVGAPLCACGGGQMEAEVKEDEDGDE